jgi:acyl-CoA synthetase (AMP-forming)/AMP-acid ligase II
MSAESARIISSPRNRLFADPAGLLVHDLILESCRRFAEKDAIVDHSCSPARILTYSQYGDFVERLATSFRSKLKPRDVIAIYLPNCWEFCICYHAATLAGCIPTLLNPSYRQREVRYQLENSGAAILISDGALIKDVDLSGLPQLRAIYTTRTSGGGAAGLAELLRSPHTGEGTQSRDPKTTIGALPYSSGTTGLPKGVLLSHSNLVTNVFQFLVPDEESTYTANDVTLCCLPLYHIYGLNVVLNPILTVGGKLVLTARFDETKFLELIAEEQPTFLPLVPPLINCLCKAAERGHFPHNHRIRYSKSGAAPLAPELARGFTEFTGIRIRQGYGMTEASPVTHIGYIEADRYAADTIGPAVAQTDCQLVGEQDGRGELVMRGPQFMLGYWDAPEASAAVLRDGWYWSGDVATIDDQGFFRIIDRVKEMIKFKGFPVAPAEVEAVLLEHPLVRDCGIVGKPDPVAGEIPCAFVVLRDGNTGNARLADELSAYVGERLTSYKQPRDVRFVHSIPRNPSGKVLRRKLREEL